MLAFAGGSLALAAALMMLSNHRRLSASDPLGAPELPALRERLHANPADDGPKRQIREIDLRERTRYFTQVRRNTWGAWILLAGGGLFIFAAGRLRSMRRLLPAPEAVSSLPSVEQKTPWSAALSGIVILGSMATIALSQRSNSLGLAPALAHNQQPPLGSSPSSAAPTMRFEQAKTNWPRFRGFDGNALVAATNMPMVWNAESGRNMAWRSPVPLPGFNSPVVWGDRIFFTGSDGRARELFCFDLATGQIVWRRPVALVSTNLVEKMEIPDLAGLAAPTVATDGERVYAIFATGELMAADFQGRLAWSKNLGPIENAYGHATSLLTWRDRLIVQLDQGRAEDGKSRLYALDGASGEVIWQQRRSVAGSWATPIVIPHHSHGAQLIVLGEPWLMSYDPENGREHWRWEGLGGDLAPSPVFANDLLFVVSPNQQLLALRPDGQGDVTKTHLVWSVSDNVPEITSPVAGGELLFTLSTYGLLTCLEGKTGTNLWEHSFDAEFNASPVIAGDRLYLISTAGDAFVVKVGRTFQPLAQNRLGERVVASPAFASDRIIVRGEKTLFCIAEGFPKSASASFEAETARRANDVELCKH